jgi:hypothetical protein
LQLAHQMQRDAGVASISAGHLASASCTRFSPNTRWPASISGWIASAPWVLEMAISVMALALRRAMRAAAAMRA